MLQAFQLDVSKVDLEEHMLQWPRWLGDSGLPQSPATAVGASLWVTVWRLRPADASAARIRKRGEACMLLSVTALLRGEVGTMHSNGEQHPDASCS
jgi:hypothetical protein